MGAKQPYSIDVPQNINHFGLLFDYSNKVTLVLAPYDIVKSTESVLPSYFDVKDVEENHGYVDFNLSGSPFTPSNISLFKSSSIKKEKLVANLLQVYYSLGWHFKVPADVRNNGSNTSILIFERAASLSTFVMCICLKDSDKIRAIAPPNLLPYIRSVISQWPNGIQRESEVDGSYEFKLRGTPWKDKEDSKSCYYSVQLINSLLEMLFNQGWVNVGSIQIGTLLADMNALYFRYDPSVVGQRGSRFFAISFNKDNIMRLFNAPSELIMPIKSLIAPKGILEEGLLYGALEWIIAGGPWRFDVTETRKLYSELLKLLKNYKWSIYATCKLSSDQNAKTVSFFRFDPYVNTRPVRAACFGLHEENTIRVIEGDQSIITAISTAILTSWRERVEQRENGRVYDFDLDGSPFYSNRKTIVYVVVMLISIMSNLKSLGLNFSCLVDLCGRFRENDERYWPADLSAWFFE